MKKINKIVKGAGLVTLALTIMIGGVEKGHAATGGISATVTKKYISGQFSYPLAGQTLRITLDYEEKHKTTGQKYSGSYSVTSGGYIGIGAYRDVSKGYAYEKVKATGYVNGKSSGYETPWIYRQ